MRGSIYRTDGCARWILLRLVKAVSQIRAINEGALQATHCHCEMISLCTFVFGIYIIIIREKDQDDYIVAMVTVMLRTLSCYLL